MKLRKLKHLSIVFFTTLLIASCGDSKEESLDFNAVEIESFSASREKLTYGQTSIVNFNLGVEDLSEFEVEWIASGGTFKDTKKNRLAGKLQTQKGLTKLQLT